MESFGSYLRRLRNENGLNQTELAAKIGLDSAGLSKIENDKKALNLDKLLLIAKALNADEEEIKKQYLSEKFAKDCFQFNCSESVLTFAVEKIKYYKSIKVKQGKLNF